MNWKSIGVPTGSKLFRVHHFTFMHKGSTYHLEVDEYGDGACTGHGEHSADKNHVIESVSAKTVEACVDGLINKIASRA